MAASGANGFLMKPFDSQELLGRVERLLDEAASAPSLPPPSQPSVVSPPPSGPAPTPASETPSDAPSSAADVTREAAAQPSPASAGTLSDDDVDRIARRVVELLTPELLRGVVSEVVPAVAETVVRERIRELEQGVE